MKLFKDDDAVTFEDQLKAFALFTIILLLGAGGIGLWLSL